MAKPQIGRGDNAVFTIAIPRVKFEVLELEAMSNGLKWRVLAQNLLKDSIAEIEKRPQLES